MGGHIATYQPPFDARIRTLAMPMQNEKKQIHRGFMMQHESMPGYAGTRAGRFKFHFLYNPSTVEATYYIQTSGGAVSYLFPNANDSGDLAVPINQSASWTLMFDRTYELNSGAYDGQGNLSPGFSSAVPTSGNLTADPRVWGVMADVWQLQYFTGMCLTGDQALTSQGGTTSAGFSGTGATSYTGSQGFMMMIPCAVFFGGQNLVKYYGYISEWDVTYTHWTQWMVPMRCVIDITFTMLPPPAPAKNSNSGGGSSGFFPTPTGKLPTAATFPLG